VVAACGNGTAGAFAPEALQKMGVAEVVEMDTELDWTFPKYNPNPEDASCCTRWPTVREFGADLALGFDGDGDRCGVVDDEGEEIFADKIGLMLARDLAPLTVRRRDLRGRREVDRPLRHRRGPGQATAARSSTGRPATATSSARAPSWAPWPASRSRGHFFMNGELGYGYDCGLTAAAAILAMLDRNPGKKLSDLRKALPVAFTSLTMSPHCADEVKYDVVDEISAEYQDLFAAGGRSWAARSPT
jgi:phosphomannomutase/phosphoglucomutase